MNNVVYKEIKGKRGFFGKLIKFIFILFNIVMIYSLISGLGNSAEHIDTLSNDTQKGAAAVGTGLGVMFLLTLWVLGDIVLGILVMFTRPTRMMVAEEKK